MRPTLNEFIVQDASLAWFKKLGYTLGHGPHLAPDGLAAEWDSFGEVALVGRFCEATRRLNQALKANGSESRLRPSDLVE